MSETSTIERLQELGLTEYQSRAYVAAVKLGRSPPGDLAEESGVPQARIYDVIDDLEAEGLVEVHSQVQGKEVTAPSPQTMLNQFKRRRIDRLSETVSDAISDLERLYHRTEENPDAYVSMVGREESALRHARQAIEEAEWWLTIAVDAARYPQMRERIEAALDRNVTVRLLLTGEKSTVEDHEYDERLQVRYRQIADTYIASDRDYGVFNSKHPAKSGQPYVITQERNLVLLLQNYSEQVWPASTVLQARTRQSRRYLDPWRAIIDRRDELDEGAELYATVRGTTTDTHRQETLEGTIVDYRLEGPVDADYTVSSPVEASLTIETDQGRVTVGGWKATMEDVAADGLEITRM